MSDVKKMDYSLLKGNVEEVHNKHLKGSYFQKGVLRKLRQDYDRYIMLGETRCISTWLFLILSKFYRKRKYIFGHMVGMEKRAELSAS